MSSSRRHVPAGPADRAGRGSHRALRAPWSRRARRSLPRSGPNDVEEDHALLEFSFVSPGWEGAFRCPSYMDWLLSDEDHLSDGWRYHRRILKLLQWRWPAKRWLLGAPTHTLSISTRSTGRTRMPASSGRTGTQAAVIASVCSLLTMVREAFVTNPEPAELGPVLCRNWAQGVNRAMRFRDRVGDERFFDVAHREQLLSVRHGVRAARLARLADVAFTRGRRLTLARGEASGRPSPRSCGLRNRHPTMWNSASQAIHSGSPALVG